MFVLDYNLHERVITTMLYKLFVNMPLAMSSPDYKMLLVRFHITEICYLKFSNKKKRDSYIDVNCN